MGLIDKMEFKRDKKKADLGDSFMQYLVGRKYEMGLAVQKDYEEAYRYYKLSADQGDSRGQWAVGRAYENGYGVQKNYEEAYRYYKLSADQGNPYGQFALGKFYENGYGVQKDYEEAYRYYKLSTVIADALVALGRFCENGYGIEQDYEEAYRYYKFAEDKIAQTLFDHVEDSLILKKVVCFTLGRFYENGYGVQKDYEEARRYYLMSEYYPEAKVALGKLYENGYGVPQDYEKAAEYYSRYLGVSLSTEAFIRLYESGCIDKNKHGATYRSAKRLIKRAQKTAMEETATTQGMSEKEDVILQKTVDETERCEPKIIEELGTEKEEMEEGYAFISYSTQNQMAADSINNLLQDAGIRTWMAPNDIPAGSKYAAVINRAVKECACFVLILSNDSQNSQWVAKEVERAINHKKSIITIQIEDVILNDEFEFYISTDQIVAVQKIDKDSIEIKKVLASVKALTKNMV